MGVATTPFQSSGAKTGRCPPLAVLPEVSVLLVIGGGIGGWLMELQSRIVGL